jgi:glucans biosynthesis protein C
MARLEKENVQTLHQRNVDHNGSAQSALTAGSSQETSRPSKRLYFIDNLRVALTMLVIVHHLAITYGVVAPWYYVEPPENDLVTLILLVFVLANQAYFMGLFFLISGYFTPGSYARRGARSFLAERFVRLGIPIVLFVFVLGPLATIPAFEYINSIAAPGEEMSYAALYRVSLGVGPLWFLEVLLFFALFYALWRRFRRNEGGSQAQHTRTESNPPSVRAIALFALGLALATFVWRIWVPLGYSLPLMGLPTPSHLPQYIALFGMGILAYRHKWLMSITRSVGRRGMAVAVGSLVVLMIVALADLEGFLTNFAGGLQWHAFVYALWEAIFCVGISLGLITFFRERVNGQGSVARFLSTHAYTVYIIHAPVIVGLAYALQGIELQPLLKFVVVSLIAVPLCFGCAYFVRKLPQAERVL